MTPRLQSMLDYINRKQHHVFRHAVAFDLAETFAKEQIPVELRTAYALQAALKAETPVFLPEESISFLATVTNLPEYYTQTEMGKLMNTRSIAEMGHLNNVCPDYASVIFKGLEAVMAELGEDEISQAQRICIQAVLDLCDRYSEAAQTQGLTKIAATLKKIPRKPAETFYEALQFFRILHFTLWKEGEYHNGIGRFDQYMYPIWKQDLDAGRMTKDESLELLEEFFLSFNRDSDLYHGAQQGDNGQSMMLGGTGEDGHDAFNELSELCLIASKELKLIDPKINVRLTKETPMHVLELGSELTAKGLGFPQYSNDDIVIPALERWGYAPEDARNYTVAACWEFIIPGQGMDVPNIAPFNLPDAVVKAMKDSNAASMEQFLEDVRAKMAFQVSIICQQYSNFYLLPAPFISLLFPCAGPGRDLSTGGKYNNFGVHGCGFSNAVDSLVAIQKIVFDEKRLSLRDFHAILMNDYKDHADLLAYVRNSVPKMGNGDSITQELFAKFASIWADVWEGKRNCRGGIWRPGTGTAMFYVWYADSTSSTPDGRLKGEPLAANFSPSIGIETAGPLSVIGDFACADMARICNGGPLTIEIHDSVFREPDGVKKTAAMLDYFRTVGGHQIQLNAINRDTLLEAQKHPELYRNLIVRVWGWSGYFVELDKMYQDHIIARAEMNFER